MPKRPNGFWMANLLLLLLILLRYLPLAFGTKWLWGVGHLTLLSVDFLVWNSVLCALVLVLPHLSQIERVAESISALFSNLFFEGTKRRLYLAIVLGGATAVFALFRMPTHFLGDGYSYLADLGSSTGHWTRWSEGGAMGIVLAVQSFLKERNEGTVEGIYQWLSIFSGLTSLWFYFLIARVISRNAVVRLLTFSVLVLSPVILLYFGYVESYPVMFAPLLGSLYFGLRYADEGKGLVVAILLGLAAIAMHLEAILMVPGLMYLVLSRKSVQRVFGKYKPLIIAGIVVLVGCLALMVIENLWPSLAFRNIFVPLLSGKPSYPQYTVFSSRHLSDIFNLGLLVFPCGLLFVSLAIRGRFWNRWTQSDWFLVLVSATGGAFLLLVDPLLSMPRDWDLFSACLIAPMLLVLRAIQFSELATIRRLALSIILLSGLVCASWLGITLNEGTSIKQTAQIIDDNPERSFGPLSILEMWCDKNGLWSARDSLEARRVVMYPDFYRAREIITALDNGEFQKAESTLAYIRPDEYSKDYNQIMAEVLLRRKSLDSALTFAMRTVDVQPTFDRGYVTLALVHYVRQEQAEAFSALYRGYKLNRESLPLLLGLAANYLTLGQFDSVMTYCALVQKLNPDEAQSYFYQYLAFREVKRDSAAVASATQYLRLGAGNPGYAGFRRVIIEDYPELDSVKPVLDTQE